MKVQKLAIVTLIIILAQIGIAVPMQAAPAADAQVINGVNLSNELIIYVNSSTIEFKEIKTTSSRKTDVKQGVSYVSLRSIAELIGYSLKYGAENKTITLVSGSYEAEFTLNSPTYQVNGASKTMRGASYLDEGVFMIPLTSLTTAFQIPYTLEGNKISLKIPVEPSAPIQQNQAPIAYFTTDKDKYRMGELITITDQSTDEENSIVDRKWVNDKPAFFQPGIIEIVLEVTDQHGLTSVYKQQIEITSETLYSSEEFAKLYTPIGNNFEVHGSSVLSMKALPYTFTTEPYTLFRASGPETVNSEGILYQDTIMGPTRFMIHHMNNLNEKAKFYMIAENKNEVTAHLDIQSLGIAGPSPYPELSGRLAGTRYLNSAITGNEHQDIELAAGESKVIFEGLSTLAAASGDVISMNGDLMSDSPIQYTILMVTADHNPLEVISTLPDLDPHESIVRGTFADSTRIFEYNGLVGESAQRLPLTDNTTDPFQQGRDGIKGTIATNSGNYGVLYKIVLNHVNANTIIAFNPRGGRYFGSARVNQNVVDIKHNSSIQDSASVLYRTQGAEEKVELWISPAAGSNLPFTLLFLPLPANKE
ncbi:copper amine oxidase N-terminal domain-containing protein [Paenibacillus sp. FA6]|uniref:copper amine oxidase N-terminal domain-containing protein n=1 Tax=Paenibacillus sp. FA6 TaxID=3413029 RepID=UPI003F65BE09